jgi:4-hydroxyphenylpyruvate dioxygenase
MFNWSIATVCLGGTLETKLAAIAKAGFRAVELFENDLTFFSGSPRDVRRMADDLGLSIVALQPMRDFEAMPEPARRRNFERAQRKFDMMGELGTNLLCLCSNVSPEVIDDPARAAADLAELADLARTRGLRIGYEALAWGHYTRDWMQAWEIVRLGDRPNLGIVLDTFHACVRNNPVAPMAGIPGDKIALVQICDAPNLLMDPLALSRHHRCFPGQGDLPVDDYLKATLATGYRGPLSLEIFNEQFRGASAAQIAQDGMRSLQACGERLAQAGVRDVERLPGAALPMASPSANIEFVEFTAVGHDAERLEAMLTGMGFHLAGHHRSKDVLLYRQNDVNIVVNRERDGFSHSFYLVHGASVCALALGVDSVAQSVERAAELGSATYFGRIGPGEATIPAVRAVEGSLLYLIENSEQGRAFWERDFVLIDGETKGPLKRVDHLSNAVRRAEFLSWITFYKTVLGFEDAPQVEVIDPYGAFYSRVVRSKDGAVQIPVTVSDGGATVGARFLDAAGGAGVQQIAYETDDLFAFVEKARAEGVPFLTIPDNYYDDLDARFGLDPALLDRLRSLHILYDRIGNGEFLHIYTETFEDRFFFEFVERRDYTGFGAANTPVRLVAQARSQDQVRQSRVAFED